MWARGRYTLGVDVGRGTMWAHGNGVTEDSARKRLCAFFNDFGDMTIYGLRKGNWMSLKGRSRGAFVNVGSKIEWYSIVQGFVE